jgi:ectoine hydroxylase-related dioxygenase (phytanoyl-CoA dioxygenase family)
MTVRKEGDLASDGYVIVRGAVPLTILGEVREALSDGLMKIGEPTERASLDDLLFRREAQDHDHVYQASNFVGSSMAAYRLIAHSDVTGIVEEVTGAGNLHVMPMTVSIQFPDDPRYDYKWHQEGSFYPWAPRVINAWVPLVRPTSVNSGTMFVLPGSHRRGQRSAETYYSHQKFRQMECGVTDEETAREVPMELELGDFVIFDADLVHRSELNHSSLPRLVCILRYIPMNTLQRARPLYKALSFEV